LVTDHQHSVISALAATRPQYIAYTPYGHRPTENGLMSLLGFNGEQPDPLTGHYHLGNGYRQFNPVLMRFNSPDSWSPFGDGGINSYAYCEGDPRNRSDPTGHVNVFNALKNPLSRISNQSKTISRRDVNRERAGHSSSPITASASTTKKNTTTASSKLNINDINTAVSKIHHSEPIAQVIGSYTDKLNIGNLKESTLLYTNALKEYPFTPLRKTPKIFVPDVATPIWAANGQLDVRHFDVSISIFRNMVSVHPEGHRFSVLADIQEIRRANYIRQNTGIDLLK
jgi:RHS repeat-associated protein